MKPTQFAVWADEEAEYYTCPLHFVPANVLDWFEEYAYYSEFTGAAPPYHILPAKWYEAAREYRKWIRVIGPKKSDITGDALNTLRSGRNG